MHDEPIPEPGAGEVRLRITSVGVCASDLHYYRDGRIGATVVKEPLVIGHEAAGVVDALGEGVTSHKVGDRVAIEPTNPCGKCELCRAGHYNVCPNVRFFGTPPENGCFREYLTWPAACALKVPDSMTHDEAAIVEPMAVGIYAVKLAEVKPDQTVAVLGAGAIGLSTVQAARVAGIKRIIVSEPVQARRDLAKRLGASEVIDPSTVDAEKEFARLTDGHGPDVVIECTGEDDATLAASRIVRILGRIVVVGIPNRDTYTFEASPSRRKEMTVVFCRRSNLVAETAIEWIAEGKVDAACMATHRFPLEDTAKAMELAMSRDDGVVRAIVTLNE
jgi:L-iditol 2-dehydrogenase